MINHNNKRGQRKIYRNAGLTGAESPSQGAFINNAWDGPGGRGLKVKATRGNTTRQTKR